MTSNPAIFRTTKLVMGQRGENAASYAASSADGFLEDGDMASAAVWRRILSAIYELGICTQKSLHAEEVAMRWALRFFLACAGAIAAVLVGAWAIAGFATFGLHGGLAIALVLGVILSCVVGIGLMAAIFYSARSGQDDTVHRVHEVEDSNRS